MRSEETNQNKKHLAQQHHVSIGPQGANHETLGLGKQACTGNWRGGVWPASQHAKPYVGSSFEGCTHAGQHVPKGRAAVGWRIAVHWREDAKFYAGEVISFDTATGKHQVLYDDGESAAYTCIDLCFRSCLDCGMSHAGVCFMCPQDTCTANDWCHVDDTAMAHCLPVLL